MRKNKEYALYKGDDLLGIGTIEELSKKLNVKKQTIKFYGSDTYKHRGRGIESNKRRILIEV